MISLSIGNVIDIILLAAFFLALVRGWYVGLAMRVAHFVVLIASVFIAYTLVRVVDMAVLFPVFFLISVVVLNQLAKVVKIVEWIPVVGTVNKIGGALLGLLISVVVCYVFLQFFVTLCPEDLWKQFGLTKEVIEKTYLLKVFLE